MPLQIIRQDITLIKCDAVVNPTDRWLSGSGGADAAIHDAAGIRLDEHCEVIGSLSVGEAIITPAYDMPYCKHIIHVAGPLWRGGLDGERVLLKSCYAEALKLAVKNKCKSIAFPLIASGTYGYPKEKVLKVATKVISEFLETHEMDVYIIVYDKTAYRISQHLQADIESFIDNNYIDRHASARTLEREEEIYREYKMNSIPNGYFGSVKMPKAPKGAPRKKKNDEDWLSDSDGSYDCSISLDNFKLEDGFADTLFKYIDQRGLTNAQAYKRSNVSRKTFSKIQCDKNYHPSKVTAVSFAIGLKLNLEETRDLLASAGICLSRAIMFDVIIEYFITSGTYADIHEVNEVLYQYDQVLLGC